MPAKALEYPYDRRTIIGAGLLMSVLLLPGCGRAPTPDLTEIVRRLLMISAQRAFAALMAPNGFYDSQVARIALSDQVGGARTGNMLAAVLTSAAVRERLTHQVNRAAEKGAERAAPIVIEAIRTMPVHEALAIIGGGGNTATEALRGQMGDALVRAMLPGIDEGLRLFDSEIVTTTLRLATGIDFTGLRDEVTRKAADAVYAAIGQQERAIRADPRMSNDPMLIAALLAGG